jgi:mannose-6-phosphate isomerase-like protein (cupin superfamily)
MSSEYTFNTPSLSVPPPQQTPSTNEDRNISDADVASAALAFGRLKLRRDIPTDEELGKIGVFAAAESLRDDSPQNRIVLTDQPGLKIEVASVRIHYRWPPNGYHVNDTMDKIILLLRGHISVVFENDKEVSLLAGESVRVPARVPHIIVGHSLLGISDDTTRRLRLSLMQITYTRSIRSQFLN